MVCACTGSENAVNGKLERGDGDDNKSLTASVNGQLSTNNASVDFVLIAAGHEVALQVLQKQKSCKVDSQKTHCFTSATAAASLIKQETATAEPSVSDRRRKHTYHITNAAVVAVCDKADECNVVNHSPSDNIRHRYNDISSGVLATTTSQTNSDQYDTVSRPSLTDVSVQAEYYVVSPPAEIQSSSSANTCDMRVSPISNDAAVAAVSRQDAISEGDSAGCGNATRRSQSNGMGRGSHILRVMSGSKC